MSEEGRQVHLSTHAAAVLITVFESTKVTLGNMNMKAGIAEKIDATLKGPIVKTWSAPAEGEAGEAKPHHVVPETGAGYDEYRIVAGPLTLTKAEAEHVKETFDSMMDPKKGFPAKLARGVLELNQALVSWGAAEKKEEPAE